MSAEALRPTTDLDYPFPTPPLPGDVLQVANGVNWLRMPLPGRLDHVNLWLLEADDGWTIVDCGLNNEATDGIWRGLFQGMLADRPIRSIILTHSHVDHIGYLGHLTERTGAPITMTIAEYLSGSARIFEPSERMERQAVYTMSRCGCPPDLIEAMVSRRREVRGSYSGIPPYYIRAVAGQTIAAGGRRWEVHTFGGHSPEMLCLYDPTERLLIAGDQVLSQITPSINIFPAEPWGDPLSAFYESFPRLEAFPDDTFVLPSHGRPFYGLHTRISQVREHHQARLAKILSFVEGGATPYEVALKTFARAMAEQVARQALAETLAHLHFLENRGAITATIDDAGVIRYSPAARHA